VVREALADGSHLSRGASAPGVPDAQAMVGYGDTAHRSGVVGVVLPGHALRPPTNGAREGSRTIRRAAWYDKSRPTFTDALALVGKELWAQEETFRGSLSDSETVKVPRAFMKHLTDAVCYAA
jgi:hypothetical protein